MNVRLNLTGRCHYCDRRTFLPGSAEVRADRGVCGTLDHVIPKSMGGTKDHSVMACRRCNEVRASTHYELFKYWVENVNLDTEQSAMRVAYGKWIDELALNALRDRKPTGTIIDFMPKIPNGSDAREFIRHLTSAKLRRAWAAWEGVYAPYDDGDHILEALYAELNERGEGPSSRPAVARTSCRGAFTRKMLRRREPLQRG